MTPYFGDSYEPDYKDKWQDAYRQGFEAGKFQAEKKIKKLLVSIKELEAVTMSTGTFSNTENHEE